MFTTAVTGTHLTRSQLWSTQIKDVITDELMAQGYVNWLSDFPDGDTFNIPSIGDMITDDYVENTEPTYRAMDTGNFQFSITEYVSAATYITNKAKQDAFYMNQIISTFVPKQARAISERVEKDILNLAMSQTLNNTNLINGAAHRFIASGTNEVITISDFSKALYALKKANIPDQNLIAIVDPSVEYTLNTLSNIVNVSNNPKWEGIITSGIGSGMKFIKNIFGFDVYTSNRLADANETIGGVTTTAGKANLFFSASSDVLPFMGAWRQMPVVDSAYNKDRQRDEYMTTARYGVKLYRPENLVVIPADTDQV